MTLSKNMTMDIIKQKKCLKTAKKQNIKNMAKLKLIIISVVACILAASISANVILIKETSRKNKQLEDFKVSLQSLSDSFSDISKQKTYSISLAPNIVNKNTAAFGKVSSVTLQYYFTMDGNKIELLPDSTKTIVGRKELKK